MVDRFAAFSGRTPSRAAVSRFAIPVARDTSRASGRARLPPSPLEQHKATGNGHGGLLFVKSEKLDATANVPLLLDMRHLTL